MPKEMVGAWSREDYVAFLRLDVELLDPWPPPNTLAALYRMTRPATEVNEISAAKVKDAWAIREKTPIYKSLKSNELYKKSFEVFCKSRAKAKHNSKLNLPTAPFVFQKILVENMGTYFLIRDLSKKYGISHEEFGPTAKRRALATKCVTELLKLEHQGVYLRGMEGAQLKSLLLEFRDQLMSLKRKPRADSETPARSMIQRVAYEMWAKLQLRSPAIVAHFASLIEAECDIRTAARYCDKAQSKYRADLAAALQSLPDK
jgi:hypothetical protein